jgi:KDO2-lipid IV(A) lauroyltransferase
MEFLNQDTGVLFGAEKYARDFDLPVLYARINKESRGYYSLEFFEVESDPKNAAYGQIIEKATRMLEQDIRREPRFWLWSHRRWKHKRPEQIFPVKKESLEKSL